MVDQPRFSIISAVYDVGRYLPDFIASIETQDFDLSRVEVVVVDDGSRDDSLELLRAWAARRPELVKVITQANAGQGAARNAGIAAATGEWITFPDPDDVLETNYLRAADTFITANPSVELVATNRLMWDEASGETRNNHPLHRFFSYDRLADLDVNETSFHGSAPAAFFRLARLREHGLTFDSRIRPNFEDGHFTALYLLHCPKPVVGFLKSTAYHYRKRADQSSSLQGSMLHPGRYTDAFEHGYLAILDSAARLHGKIPRWLQYFLVYELAGYLTRYEHGKDPVISDGPETDAFHTHMSTVLAQIELDHVLARAEWPMALHTRKALQHGYSVTPWVDEDVFVDKVDPVQKLARVRYFFSGTPPTEEIYNSETPVGPRHAKTRTLDYYGRTLLRERVLWVRYAPDLRVRINGDWAVIRFERKDGRVSRANAYRIQHETGTPSRLDEQLIRAAQHVPTSALATKARAHADKPRSKKRYANAWVLMDRIHDAGDSGEILFRRLRHHHSEVNAWFVIEKGTPDYKRLRAEFGKRVIAHGTLEWMALMANCRHLLSSHADVPIMEPPAVLDFHPVTWRFTFLQHGVIKDDLNSWLGKKAIDLFVTSTTAEHASIAGDGNRYPFTTKEVKLTGLPRFDRLRETGLRFPPQQRDLILLAPTWRNWLVAPIAAGSQRRQFSNDVLESEFVQQWLTLLRSDELAEICRTHSLKLGFLPHPNMQALLEEIDLPDHVLPLTYDGNDVQEYFARARVLVTDYSSIAFNAAYLNRPVVYFQFDADLVRQGGHVGRPGYFSYERDGFGPVTADATRSVAAIGAALNNGPDPVAEYQQRIDAAFTERDGRCSERVIAAVKAMDQPDIAAGQVPTSPGHATT